MSRVNPRTKRINKIYDIGIEMKHNEVAKPFMVFE